MNNKQLQEAIDKAREFVSRPADGMQSMLDSKKNSVEHLRKLEQIQLQRAAMVTAPLVSYGGAE